MMTTVLAVLLAVGKIGSPLSVSQGYATWYDDGPGLYGAVHSWHYGDKPYPVQVCHGGRCVTVLVRDFCACGDRSGHATVIDLSPSAFTALAPLSRGVISVTVKPVSDTPPATDTWVRPQPMTADRILVLVTAWLTGYVLFKAWLERRLR